jgi:hypothetical protein
MKLVGKCACDHVCVWLQSSGRDGKRMYVAKRMLPFWFTGEFLDTKQMLWNNARGILGNHAMIA